MTVGKDKIQHAGGCFVIAALFGFWSPWWGFLITCVIGAHGNLRRRFLVLGSAIFGIFMPMFLAR